MEIRFHGRGGQGVVTAAELLAISAFFDGKHSQAFPFFGVERRGAPVMSFCRIDKKPIRVHQQIYYPDYVVVLDSGLIGKVEVAAGIKKEGILIINTKKEKDGIGIKANKIFVVDATSISLKTLGKPIVNTAMLGAFAKVSGLVSLESVKKAIGGRFSSQLAEKNILAVEKCYEEVK